MRGSVTAQAVLIDLKFAVVETEIPGRDAKDVCERVNRSMRMCGVKGVAQVKDGVVIVRELE